MLNILTLAALMSPVSMASSAVPAGPASPPNGPAPFVKEWRVVMSSEEARLLPYAGAAFKVERRKIRGAELDALEARLLPALVTRLKSVHAPDPPSSYFRQYAAARAGRHRLILVHGYLRDAGRSTDWSRKPSGASDGRVHFWDAVYVVERHQFVKLKQEGDGRAVILLQQAATAAPDAPLARGP